MKLIKGCVCVLLMVLLLAGVVTASRRNRTKKSSVFCSSIRSKANDVQNEEVTYEPLLPDLREKCRNRSRKKSKDTESTFINLLQRTKENLDLLESFAAAENYCEGRNIPRRTCPHGPNVLPDELKEMRKCMGMKSLDRVINSPSVDHNPCGTRRRSKKKQAKKDAQTLVKTLATILAHLEVTVAMEQEEASQLHSSKEAGYNVTLYEQEFKNTFLHAIGAVEMIPRPRVKLTKFCRVSQYKVNDDFRKMLRSRQSSSSGFDNKDRHCQTCHVLILIQEKLGCLQVLMDRLINYHKKRTT